MAKKLENKNIMQKNFIDNVSHDFKTPLSVIRNYSESIYDSIIEENQKKDYSKGHADKFDFKDEQFNGVISNFVFHEVKSQPNKQLVVREVSRVVKKEEYLLFMIFFRR